MSFRSLVIRSAWSGSLLLHLREKRRTHRRNSFLARPSLSQDGEDAKSPIGDLTVGQLLRGLAERDCTTPDVDEQGLLQQENPPKKIRTTTSKSIPPLKRWLLVAQTAGTTKNTTALGPPRPSSLPTPGAVGLGVELQIESAGRQMRSVFASGQSHGGAAAAGSLSTSSSSSSSLSSMTILAPSDTAAGGRPGGAARASSFSTGDHQHPTLLAVATPTASPGTPWRVDQAAIYDFLRTCFTSNFLSRSPTMLGETELARCADALATRAAKLAQQQRKVAARIADQDLRVREQSQELYLQGNHKDKHKEKEEEEVDHISSRAETLTDASGSPPRSPPPPRGPPHLVLDDRDLLPYLGVLEEGGRGFLEFVRSVLWLPYALSQKSADGKMTAGDLLRTFFPDFRSLDIDYFLRLYPGGEIPRNTLAHEDVSPPVATPSGNECEYYPEDVRRAFERRYGWRVTGLEFHPSATTAARGVHILEEDMMAELQGEQQKQNKPEAAAPPVPTQLQYVDLEAAGAVGGEPVDLAAEDVGLGRLYPRAHEFFARTLGLPRQLMERPRGRHRPGHRLIRGRDRGPLKAEDRLSISFCSQGAVATSPGRMADLDSVESESIDDMQVVESERKTTATTSGKGAEVTFVDDHAEVAQEPLLGTLPHISSEGKISSTSTEFPIDEVASPSRKRQISSASPCVPNDEGANPDRKRKKISSACSTGFPVDEGTNPNPGRKRHISSASTTCFPVDEGANPKPNHVAEEQNSGSDSAGGTSDDAEAEAGAPAPGPGPSPVKGAAKASATTTTACAAAEDEDENKIGVDGDGTSTPSGGSIIHLPHDLLASRNASPGASSTSCALELKITLRAVLVPEPKALPEEQEEEEEKPKPKKYSTLLYNRATLEWRAENYKLDAVLDRAPSGAGGTEDGTQPIISTYSYPQSGAFIYDFDYDV